MNNIHTQPTLDLAFLHRIDINLYPLFIAIFQYQNISHAAQQLSITQSAASHALQRLRHQLNDDLFVRVGSKMRPTPFAEQIFPQIQSVLNAIQQMSAQQHAFKPESIQQLRIAVHNEIEPLLLPKLVQHFEQLHLDIEFLSLKLDRKTMVADLATQQIDFVIDLEQYVDAKIQFQSLVKDHFVLCTQRTQVDFDTYLHAPHIGVSSRRSGLLLEDMYLSRQNVKRVIQLRCQHYLTALQILQDQPESILTLPSQLLSYFKLSDALHILEMPISLPQLNMGIFWHNDLNLNKRHQFLKNEIIKIFA